MGGCGRKNLKKNLASSREWTHNYLVKQKVDEFSPKALPLSYWDILKRDSLLIDRLESEGKSMYNVDFSTNPSLNF